LADSDFSLYGCRPGTSKQGLGTEQTLFDKVKDIKAKYDKKKDKVIFKETLFKRFNMPMPEKDCVSLGSNGGDLIEVTIKPDGSKEYIKITKNPVG